MRLGEILVPLQQGGVLSGTWVLFDYPQEHSSPCFPLYIMYISKDSEVHDIRSLERVCWEGCTGLEAVSKCDNISVLI